MLGNLKSEDIKLGRIFTYIQAGSNTVNLEECDTIYRGRKALAKYEIISFKKNKDYEFTVTAKIIELY